MKKIISPTIVLSSQSIAFASPVDSSATSWHIFTAVLFVASILGVLLYVNEKLKSLKKERDAVLIKNEEQEKLLYLSSKQTSVGEILGNIAHQWKQPLNALSMIQNNLKVSLAYGGEIDEEKIIKSADMSFELIEHLSETIDTFYGFLLDKNEKGDVFFISQSMDAIRKITEYPFDGNRIELCVHTNQNPKIEGSINEFTHAVLNIVLNAKDAIDSRNISHPKIIIEAKEEGAMCVLTISDNAGGINIEPLDSVFDLHVTQKDGGSGLGLYIAQNIIVRRFGGEISVENGEEGALFCIKIPCRKMEAKHLALKEAPKIELGNKLNLEHVKILTNKITALEHSERLFRALAENSPDIMIRYDRECRVKYTNPAYEHITGLSHESAIGRRPVEFADYLSANMDLSEYQAFLERAMDEKKTLTYDIAVSFEDGRKVYHHIIGSPEFDEKSGEVVGILAIGRDMSEKIHTERKLAQTLRRFDTLVNNQLDFITRFDTNGRYLFANRATLEMFQLPLKEIEGKTICDIEDSLSNRRIQGSIKEAIRTGKANKLEATFICDGEEHLFEVQHIPEFSDEGELISVLGMAHNIGVRKRYERSLVEGRKKLQTLADNISSSLERYDANCRLVYVNKKFEQLFGISFEHTKGKTPTELGLPDAEFFESKIKGVIQGGRQESFEYEFGKNDDDKKYYHILITPEFGEKREVAFVQVLAHDVTKIKLISNKLAKTEEEYRTIAENSLDAIIRYDLHHRRVYVNTTGEKLFGRPASEILGKTPSEFSIVPQSVEFEKVLDGVMSSKKEIALETSLITPEGNKRCGYMHIIPEFDSNRMLKSVLVVARDVTTLKEQERRLRHTQKIAKIGYWRLDMKSNRIVFSEEIYNMLEIQQKEQSDRPMTYESFFEFVHPEDRSALGEAFFLSLKERFQKELTHRVALEDGKIKYVRQIWENEYDQEGNPVATFGAMQDISEQKLAQSQIEFMAHYDMVTSLPNRITAREKAEQVMARAENEGKQVAFLFADLDGFKAINDTLGHAAGDKILKLVAGRMRESIGINDILSRQNGDEFLVIVPDAESVDDVLHKADEILNSFERPFYAHSHLLSLSVSMGIAFYPDNGDMFDELLQKADMAMYRAKEDGRNTYKLYTEDMNKNIAKNLKIKNELKDAIVNEEFVLHYQPQIDMTSREIVGVEALIRWQHPTLGLVPPSGFISVAESSGYIVTIGEWILKEACRQCAKWHENGYKISIAVNISAVQFRRNNIVNVVKEALKDSGLNPSFLELELTESILISDSENVLLAVRNLKDLGVKLSIDDFGTGYSSLSYLKRFAVDKLKIDRSFVMDIVRDQEDAIIVKTIIQMTKSLNLKTIAEGVENKDVLNVLVDYGCDEVQGYYFATPMEAEAFENYHKESSIECLL